MTFSYRHATGVDKRVVAENADEAHNKLNAWSANEGLSLDGWIFVGAETVTSADKPEPAMVTLRQPLSLDECQTIRVWRNAPDVAPMLRTGSKTVEEQARFYRDVICKPYSEHRYYAVLHESDFIGIGGLTYLLRVPGEAEISLVLGPDFRRQGYGSAAVDALLEQAWALNLTAVVGECFPTGAVQFWRAQIERHAHEVPKVNAGGVLSWRWVKP